MPPQFREQAAAAADQAFVTGLNEILLVGAAIAFVGGIAGWLLVRRRDLVAVPAARRAGDGRRRGRAGALTPRGANPSAPAAKTDGVLLELRIENLLLIERAELRLEPGLNAITGETGAGKTVLAHSLDLLMGGRARPQIVRPGAEEAWVEGVFALPAGPARRPRARRDRRAAARRTPTRSCSGGGSAPRAGPAPSSAGASASAAELRALGSRLLAFYGQHEHRRLTLASAQLEILDGFAGAEHARACATRYRAAHARGRRARARARRAARARGRARARPRPAALRARRDRGRRRPTPPRRPSSRPSARRLRHAEGLRAAAARALAAISGEPTRTAAARARRSARPTPALARGRRRRPRARRARRARCARPRSSSTTSAGDLRAYLDGIEAEPGRLEAVEERLDALDRLKRKHGGSIEAVLAHAERCRAEIERLENAEEVAAELDGADRARPRRGAASSRRSSAPRGARPAERLGERVAGGARRAGDGGRAARGRARAASRRLRARTAPRRSSCSSRPTPGCRPRRSRTRPRAASSRGSCSRSPASAAATGPTGRWSSTRSTPGSAATPRARSASGCARSPPAGRCSASPTCRRSPRWPRPTSGSRRTPPAARPRATVERVDGDELVAEIVRMLGAEQRRRGRQPPRAAAAQGRLSRRAGRPAAELRFPHNRRDGSAQPGARAPARARDPAAARRGAADRRPRAARAQDQGPGQAAAARATSR